MRRNWTYQLGTKWQEQKKNEGTREEGYYRKRAKERKGCCSSP